MTNRFVEGYQLAENAKQVMEEFSYSDIPPAVTRPGEYDFLVNYDPSRYGLTEDSVVHTADFCVLTFTDTWRVLLIQRKNHPFKGFWCLPGGFVDADESVLDAAVRELEEETGTVVTWVGEGDVYDTPWRDPRLKHTVTHAYYTCSPMVEVSGKDDAVAAAWVPLSEVLSGGRKTGFDHQLIIAGSFLRNVNGPLHR